MDILPDTIIEKQDAKLKENEFPPCEQTLQPIEENLFRILIVEDDDGSREIAVKILISDGYLVKSAENGRKAIDIYNKWQPHLIIIDAKLPEMDGFEVVKKIRSTPAGKEIPVIMISGNIHEEVYSTALEIGVNIYMIKPYDFDDLLMCVAEQLK